MAQTTTPPVVTATMNQLFDLAQTKLPNYFPGLSVTQTFEKYVYRFYPTTGIYVGIADNTVYLLGGEFGQALVTVGSVSFVLSELEKFPTPGGGGGAPAANLWNLAISGSTSVFGQNIAFNGLTVKDTVAPDLNNTNEINQEIVKSLSGVATGISAIKITVVNNSSNRRTFDVQFNATANGLAIGYNLRYDYTR